MVGVFETFEHKADLGVRGIGKSAGEAFGECAKAMFSAMADLESVEQLEQKTVSVEAPDYEALLVDFLNELLYLHDAEEMLFSEFRAKIEKKENGLYITCVCLGEKLSRKKHKLKSDVKAATYSQVKAEEGNGQWIAQCVADV